MLSQELHSLCIGCNNARSFGNARPYVTFKFVGLNPQCWNAKHAQSLVPSLQSTRTPPSPRMCSVLLAFVVPEDVSPSSPAPSFQPRPESGFLHWADPNCNTQPAPDFTAVDNSHIPWHALVLAMCEVLLTSSWRAWANLASTGCSGFYPFQWGRESSCPQSGVPSCPHCWQALVIIMLSLAAVAVLGT